MLDFATCTECGRCQSVCPAWTTGKPLSPKLAHHGAARQHVRLGRPSALSGADAGVVATLVPTTIDPDVLWSLHDLRRLRRAVPGRHRARRRDHRHAPLRGADGVALPLRGRPVAAQHGEPGRPLGTGLVQAHRLAGRSWTSRCRSSTAPSPRTSSTSTGWAAPGTLDERGAQAGRLDRADAAPRRRHLRRSSVRARAAPATRRGAWATSTSSRRWPRPTSRRSTRSARRRSSPAARTASTPSRTSTRTSGATTRWSTTRSC